MKKILHQLRLVVYPVIYKVLYISGGSQDFFHQQYLDVFLFSALEIPPRIDFFHVDLGFNPAPDASCHSGGDLLAPAS